MFQESNFFWGFINFYQRIIKEYLKVIKELINLTKKNTSWVWDNKVEEMFQRFKKNALLKNQY